MGNLLPGQREQIVNIHWDEEHQTIQDFGTFAGRSTQLYSSPKRDEILELLFGESGLQLTLIRSTIFPDLNFDYDDPGHTLEHKAELWILKTAKERFKIEKFMASAWSPPYHWKQNSNQRRGKNQLSRDHYPSFAAYIVRFIEWHQKNGIDFYAISPQNEPEYSCPYWDSCVWMPSQTGDFISNFLKPKFKQRGLTTKIIAGESANWSTSHLYFFCMSFTSHLEDIDILASHGYSFPMFPSLTKVTYDDSSHSCQYLINWRKPKWITEISATDAYDCTMNKGIHFAISLCKFLNRDIEAFVFWLGMVSGYFNEALLIYDEKHTLNIPKVFYCYGQFSRHIKPGWKRISAKHFSLFSRLEVTAFKESSSGCFAIVLINKTSRMETCVLNFNPVEIVPDSVKATFTDETHSWESTTITTEKRKITVKVPSFCVMTVTGKTCLVS